MTISFRTIAAISMLCLAACGEPLAQSEDASDDSRAGAQVEALTKLPGSGGQASGPRCTVRTDGQGNTCPPPAVCQPLACTNSYPGVCTGTCRAPLGQAGGAPAPAPIPTPAPLPGCFRDDGCATDPVLLDR